jgi:hypothetical protein
MELDGDNISCVNYYKHEYLMDLIKGNKQLVEEALMERMNDKAGAMVGKLKQLINPRT